MFDGYLAFGGIELINAARTTAYLNNVMPAFPLVRRTSIYDTLPAALGDEPYRTPFLDGADWVETRGFVDPSVRNPSHEFYGLYPLSIEGIGDSTMSAAVIEGILDGGSVNSERDATRSIRVHGLLIGADQLAAEAGLTWLRNALRSNSCGMHGDLCGYHDLRYFLAPPAVCDPLWTDNFNAGDSDLPMGQLNAVTSPLVYSHGVDGQPHRYKWEFPSPSLDGVKIRWGALAFDGGEVLEEYGPLYVRRSNFILNPAFKVGTSSWAATDGTVTRIDTGTTQFGRFDSDNPVTYRTNWLPDPSFENGDPNGRGWRASGDITDETDGTAPQGTHVAVVPADPNGNWLEASMLGPYDDNVEGTLSFWKRHDSDIVVTITSNTGAVILTETLSGLADAWERVEVAVPMRRDYVVRLSTDGLDEIRVDGFLLEASPTMGTYFDGDTPDDPGSNIEYYFVSGPASPSREATGVYESFSAEAAETDAPFGPAVLSFDIRSVEARPTVLVEILDPDDTVIGSLNVQPENNWARVALGVGFGRRVRPRFSSSTGYFDLDNVMLEAGSEVNPYLDGDTTPPADYSVAWVGTPHNSISRMTWLGNTEISRRDNWRPFLYVEQGDLDAVTLDAAWSTDIAMEQQLEPYDRTYHRVYCTRGVSVIRNMQMNAGAAIEVDFVLTAATPHAFSTVPQAINKNFDDPLEISDALVNMLVNPSGEHGTFGWDDINNTGGVAAVTNPTVTTPYGTKVLRTTWSTATSGAGGGMWTPASMPVVAGAAYSILIGYLKASISNRLRVRFNWRDESDSFISSTNGPEFQVSAGVQTSAEVVGVVAPAGAANLRIIVESVAGTGFAEWSIGSYLEIDGAILAYGGVAPFFDGDTVDTDAYDYAWDGDPGESTSRRTIHVETQDPLVDPDLPPLPTPPAPPTIPDDAVETQNEWLRYRVQIPAGDVALWAGTVPTLTIATTSEDVRQVRVRFFPNPFGWDEDEIDPTSYCGEFILSYLPANSVLTVSGVTQEAWAQVAGRAPQSANHLLYGTGGTPMDWPELSCAMPYVMTVDVPPETDFEDLDIDLVVNRRE